MSYYVNSNTIIPSIHNCFNAYTCSSMHKSHHSVQNGEFFLILPKSVCYNKNRKECEEMFRLVDQRVEVITEKLFLWVCKGIDVSEEQFLIRKYALQSIFYEVIKLVLLSILFMLMGNFTMYLCSVLVLASIRRYMGGIHRKTGLGCFLQSLLTFMLVIQLGRRCFIYPYHNIINMICLTVIWKYSPVIGKGRIQYSDTSIMKFRAKAISSVLCISCIVEIIPAEISNCIIWVILYQSIETFVSYVMKEYKERRKCI